MKKGKIAQNVFHVSLNEIFRLSFLAKLILFPLQNQVGQNWSQPKFLTMGILLGYN